MLPLDRFHSFITDQALFNPSDKVLLAVSGGKDSVLMMHLFKASGLTFGIAHCNFKLRGRESDLDEEFVKDLSGQLNVPFFSVSFNTEEVSRLEGISIQMAARDLRYNWLEEIRKQNGYAYIALAHHKNDVVETMLLNLVRGTGISGMHGILPKRGHLIRPLLYLEKEEIDKIVAGNGLNFREDSSNASAKYARNKLRLEVIPKLKELNPDLEQTFVETASRFAGLEEYINSQADNLRKGLFSEASKGTYTIRIGDLKKQVPQKAMLFELFRPFNFTESVISDLAGSLEKVAGKIFESPSHIILLDRQKLILSKRDKEIAQEKLIFETDASASWDTYIIKRHEASSLDLKLNEDPGFAQLSASSLVFPLKIRSWKTGDVFHPLGMKGKKKVSDFFIGKKIPRTEKAGIPILENGNGDILWIAGLRIDDRYKVASGTEKVIIFELKKDGK